MNDSVAASDAREPREELSAPAHWAGGLGIVLAALLAASAAILPIAYLLGELLAVQAALVGGGLVLVGFLTAGLITAFIPREEPLWRLLVGLLSRMAFPLAMALVLQLRGGVLVDQGLLLYLVAYYLPALAADTWWTTRELPPADLPAEPTPTEIKTDG